MHWLIGNFTNWTFLHYSLDPLTFLQKVIKVPLVKSIPTQWNCSLHLYPFYLSLLQTLLLFTNSTFISTKYPMYWLSGVSTFGKQIIQSRRRKHRFLHWSSIAHVYIACLDSLVSSTTEHSFVSFSLSVYSQCPSNNTIPISIGLTYLIYVILSNFKLKYNCL